MAQRPNEPRTYFAPNGGHPPQTQRLTGPRVFTEAYALSPRAF